MTPTTEPIQAEPETSNESNVRYVTPAELRLMKAEEKRQKRLKKQRDIRWKSPAASAKIEDLFLFAQDIMRISNDLNTIARELRIIRDNLVSKQILTKEELDVLRNREIDRENKFKELQENTSMSVEEKTAVALEYDLSLEALGLKPNTKDES